MMIDTLGADISTTFRNETYAPGIIRVLYSTSLYHEYEKIKEKVPARIGSKIQFIANSYPFSKFGIYVKGRFSLAVEKNMSKAEVFDSISLEYILNHEDIFELKILKWGEWKEQKIEKIHVPNLSKKEFKELEHKDIMIEWLELQNKTL